MNSNEKVRNGLAVVSGASSGIGRAVAVLLASEAYDLVIIGRNLDRLNSVSDECRAFGGEVSVCCTDLTLRDAEVSLLDCVDGRPIEVLVSSAGEYLRGTVFESTEAVFEQMLRSNLLGSVRLIRSSLPGLRKARGDIVMIGSTQALGAKAGLSAYACSQYALRGFADSLRAEEFENGLRVLFLLVGRTATPRQERIFATEGREWQGSLLIQPSDVAATILHTVRLPQTAEISEMTLLPMWKA